MPVFMATSAENLRTRALLFFPSERWSSLCTVHKSFFATSTMPECAFAELDRVVRKCLLSSLNSFADVVFVVVVNREREVLPGMMRDALRFGRGAAQKLL
jgi:hypothetical protein